ncbi:hypothetical protein ACFLRB_01450 [Acidobacteriota bacterium]
MKKYICFVKVRKMDNLRSKFLKIKIRPQRIAILIPADAAWGKLQPVIRFLSVLWGGRYGAIIPIDPENNGDNSTAAKWLSTYDPDLILLASGVIKIDLKKLLIDTCPPFSVFRLFDKLEDNFRFNPGEFISLKDPVDEFVKEVNIQGTTSRFHYQIVSCDEDFQYSHLIKLMFGVWGKAEAESLAEDVRGKAVHIGKENSISDYIRLFTQQDYPLTGLDLSNREIIAVSGNNPPTIYLGTSSVADIAHFWNLRASFNPISNNILYLDENVVDDNEAIEALIAWICLPRRNIKATYCRILSPTGSSDKPHRLAKRLRLRVKNKGIAYVDVDNTNLEIPQVTFYKEEIAIEAQIIDGQNLEFKCPSFPYSSGSWVIELSKDMLSKRHILDHLPPYVTMNSSYEVLNAPSPTHSTIYRHLAFRYFAGNICRKIDRITDVIKITTPTSHEIFASYLSIFKVKNVEDEKRLRYEACINMFGSLIEAAQCFRGKFIKVFLAFEDTPLKFGEISSRTRWGKTKELDEDDFIVRLSRTPIMKDIARHRFQTREGMVPQIFSLKDFLNWLINRKIVMRRILQPKCSHCLEKNLWTERLDLREPPTCLNCGAPLTLTDKIEIGYLLNPLIRMAIREGAIPVILTLQFLNNLTRSGFMYLPGFKGELGQGNFDIDIIAGCDGELVFCECKDLNKKNSSKMVWGEIKDQFEQLIQRAKKHKARIAILSSLTQKYPASIKELVKKYSDESLSVVLLDQGDLEKGRRWQKMAIQDQEDFEKGRGSQTILDEETEFKYPLSIRDFLPRQKQKKNRKKRKGRRQISYGNFFNDVASGQEEK